MTLPGKMPCGISQLLHTEAYLHYLPFGVTSLCTSC